jgi:hypothetical protein
MPDNGICKVHHSLSTGNMFQDILQMPKTTESTEPYIYIFFYAQILMIRINL